MKKETAQERISASIRDLEQLQKELKELKKDQKYKELKKEVKKNNESNKIENIKVPIPPKKQPTVKYKVKKRGKLHYLFLILTIITSVVIFLILWFVVKKLWVILIYSLFAVPIFFLGNIVTLAKLYLDRRKIKGFIVKKLSRNFIVARIYFENNKFIRFVTPVSDNSFDYDNGVYFLQHDRIYRDSENIPHSDYDYNNPTPKQLVATSTDRTYSSQNLKKFYKDKFFSELHRGSEIKIAEIMTMIGIAIVIILVLVVVMRK